MAGSLLFLLLIALVLLLLPPSRKAIAEKLSVALSEKTGTEFRVNDFRVGFPRTLQLNGIFCRDQQGDTLVFMQHLAADLDLWKLAGKNITLSTIEVRGAVVKLRRPLPDTTFNFDFLVVAFAGGDQATAPAPRDTTPGSWKVNIGKVDIAEVRFEMKDESGGIFLSSALGAAKGRFESFDLDNYTIMTSYLKVAHAKTQIRMSAGSLPDDTVSAASAPWRVGARELLLEQIETTYADDTDSSFYGTGLKELHLADGEIDLGRSTVSVERLLMRGAAARLVTGASGQTDTIEEERTDQAPASWRIRVNSVNVSESSVALRQKGAPATRGFDPANMAFSDIALNAGQVQMNGSAVNARVNELRVSEKGGLHLTHFSGDLRYDTTGAGAKNFLLETSHSKLASDAELSYSSLGELINSPEKAFVKVSLSNCIIGMRDVLYFFPALSHSVSLSANEKLRLDAQLEGSMEDLSADLRMAWSGSLLGMKGTVRGLPEFEKMFLDLDTVVLNTGNQDILSLLPESMVPEKISLPRRLSLQGNFYGYLKNFDADLLLASSSGSIEAHITMDPASGSTIAPYAGEVHTHALELGDILQQPETGALTFSIGFEGSGFDTSSFDTELRMHLFSFQYRKYDYRNLTLQGKLAGSSFNGMSSMRDDNLSFDFRGMFDIDRSEPRFRFEFDLKGADFRALHISDKDARARGLIRADISLPPDRNPEGMAGFHDVTVILDGKKHRIDSLVFVSEKTDGEDRLMIASDKLEGEAKGKFLLPQLGHSLMKYVNDHFDVDPARRDTVKGEHDIALQLRMKDPSFLTTGLVPGLSRLSPLEVKASFSSRAPQLTVDAFLPHAVYNDIRLDSLQLFVKGDGASIRAGLNAAQISDTVNFRFENLGFISKTKNDSLDFSIKVSKDDSATVLSAAGVVLGGDSAFTLRMRPEMVLSGAAWRIDSTNVVRFGHRPLRILNMKLTDGSQEVNVFHGTGTNPSLHAMFRNFEIASLTSVMQHTVPLVAGVVNGSLVIDQQKKHTAFRSDIGVKGLTYKAAPIGDITLNADNYADPDAYDISLNVTGQGNDVVLGGTYYPNRDRQHLDLELKVRSLQLRSVQPFAGGEVTYMTGWIAGAMKLDGDVANPRIDGTLNMHEIGFRPTIIDSYLRIPGGEFRFDGQKLYLSQLNLFDSLNNRATVSGEVDLKNISEPAFNLQLSTKNFLAMNTDKTDNPLYYGKIFLDSDVKITGTPEKPTVEAKAKLNKGSAITYIKPEDQILRDESRGIVEFTDSLGSHARIMTREDSIAVPGIVGLLLNAEISIDRDFDLKVIVDPVAGDSLYIRGGGRLHFSMERSGSTALSGKYDITKGGYYLTINDIVKRDFRIAEGSSVTWSGDPLDAYVDLNAVYRVKASPYDLVQGQLAGMTELEANKYRNLLTFDVYLKMMGFISSPQISFDIQLAPEDRGAHGGAVSTRLAQIKEDENQLNKQVFALLTLRRFVGENPLESGGGGGLASAGRSSASKVLTQQLNTLSDRYVNFVDLDLGVNSYEDYSTGTEQGRTQVQVGVSKQLFNERVTVRVGGNVDVEGPYAAQNDMNDVAGNLGIDYKLTEDGRYRLKAFRENQYENPIEGEITRTGAGFVFSRDFNRFKNLFRKPRWQRNNGNGE